MATATQLKCDCPNCTCMVDLASAVKKDGKNYCSTTCANGHPEGGCCAESSCSCGG
ncbi:metallothionein family 14 [[Leptolyngbya] sp. PCC 7376]|uniref:metallothionein n=1 Tax=[Leptolyngbya] sp. PCC 7376 TaxID=111781 RepID=UPI00029EE419|nr:metallothionein [[Leptolyngbya] sp. PCC 7376]AFY36724.1 metallothionein family 14 [[Leptolyngbya] sp. PCC 7376]